MAIRDDIVRAVRERRVVALRYDRDTRGRIVHPHVVYRTRAGKECVDGYQTEGETHSGPLPDWRPFDLAKIHHLEILDGVFALAPGYNPHGNKYRHGVVARA
jgi:hypothetical protein